MNSKFSRLTKIIRASGSMLVAFSGGADSAFLLAAAACVLPRGNLLAVTAVSPTYPHEELLFASGIARKLKVRHLVITTDELSVSRFRKNPVNRCYFCKKELFEKLIDTAQGEQLAVVADASTVSDKKDYRPGSRAKEECGVRSPLVEAGITKNDVRSLSKSLGLATWDKPSLACLASRIPYGTAISEDLLKRIHAAESVVASLGFRQVRLRHHGDICRIEVPQEDIARLIALRRRFIDKLKRLGYNYITVDVEGYRTGSMNERLLRRLRPPRNDDEGTCSGAQ